MGIPSRVLAVVLNWNGHEMTARCVEHLRCQDQSGLDILIVDNGSTDGSLEALTSGVTAPGLLLGLPENVGFTGGMNAGIEAAEAGSYDYVWLVNNDAFPEPNCLSALVRFMDAEPRVAVTTPRIVGMDGVDQNFGGRIAWDEPRNDMLFPGDAIGDDIWLTGTALLIRVACLAKVGRLDPRFFAYWEDVDFCHRCRKAGWSVQPVLSTKCVHEGGASTGGAGSAFTVYMNLRNQWLFMKKTLWFWQRPRLFLRLIASGLELAGILSSRGRDKEAQALVGAVAAIFKGEVGRPRRLSVAPGVGRLLTKYGWGIGSRLGRATRWFPGQKSKASPIKGQGLPVGNP